MTVLFLGGLVLNGLGGAVERAGVLVEGDRIVAVGRGLEGRRGPDTRVVDLAGRTIMPGLIDTHIHFAGGDYFPDYERESLGLAALRTAEAARRTIMAGITTVRTAGSREFLDVDVRDAVDAGLIPGPRIIAAGRGITTTGGHLHETSMEVDGADAVVQAVRYHVKRRVNAMKVMLSAGAATNVPTVGVQLFSLEETRAAVAEAHKYGLKVLTHSIGYEAIRNGVEAGVDSIDHGYWLDEELAVRMKQAGIYLVPTFGPFYYYTVVRKSEPWRIARAEQIAAKIPDAFKLAMEIGVPIAMGSDCGAPSRFPNGENALELEMLVQYGMTPGQAIVSATSQAARAVGMEKQIGSLEPGRAADLIVVEGNPLEEIGAIRRSVRLVMKGGRVFRDELEQ